MFTKFSCNLMWTHAISSPRSQILRHMGTSCLCNIGTRSKPHNVSRLFWVYVYQTIQYKVFHALRIYLSVDAYLWSLNLDVHIIKTMFKEIFLSLSFTLCCKYFWSKNSAKFLQLTFSVLLQKLFTLNRIVSCFKLLFYFRIIFRVELKWLQTRHLFSKIFNAKFFIQVLYSLNLSRSLHSLQL